MSGTKSKPSIANWTIPTVSHLLSLTLPFRIPDAQPYSQGTYSATIFYDGFRLPIHPSIITSHPRLITMVHLSGSFKAVFSTNGSPLLRFYGCTENVCSS